MRRAVRRPALDRPGRDPPCVDIACVVVRSGMLGGRGTELAQALMARGIHALQEHPLHYDELAECLRRARHQNVVYHVNSFYPHVAPVRRFVACARELFRRQPALYIDASCGFQVAYAMFDIIASAIGGLRPWAFTAQPPSPDHVRRLTDLDIPFRNVAGVLAGVPVTIRVQNQLDPSDPDNYAHLLHRITFGTEGGCLTLLDTHGPTVWSERPQFPREVRATEARLHFEGATTRSGGLDLPPGSPCVTTLGPISTPTYREIFGSLWPAGIVRAVVPPPRNPRGPGPTASRPESPHTVPALA